MGDGERPPGRSALAARAAARGPEGRQVSIGPGLAAPVYTWPPCGKAGKVADLGRQPRYLGAGAL